MLELLKDDLTDEKKYKVLEEIADYHVELEKPQKALKFYWLLLKHANLMAVNIFKIFLYSHIKLSYYFKNTDLFHVSSPRGS
jgi:hypothetical protein